MTIPGVRAIAAQALAQVALGGESLRLVLPKASAGLARGEATTEAETKR